MLAFSLRTTRPSPRRSLPSIQKGTCWSFSARKVASRTGIQSTNAMGCGLHVCGTPCRPVLGQGGEETCISIYQQRFVHITPGNHGHFGHGPCSTKSRLCIGSADSARWESCRIITFPMSNVDRQAKEISERNLQMCCLVLETDLIQGSSRFVLVLLEKGEHLLLLIRKRWSASMSQLEMARTFVSGFRSDRRMRVKVLVSRDVGMRVSGDQSRTAMSNVKRTQRLLRGRSVLERVEAR